ncbi:MAG: DUF2452 domain-containing protein [Salibacteraceae bacterium]
MKTEDIKNPIDPDKITETPGVLEYAHHVGSALIKPEDKGKIKGRSLAAMYEQTDLQLAQIKKQIDLLADQVKHIQNRKRISEKIYQSKIGFQPIIGQVYHLYEKSNGDYQVSMLSQNEWGRSMPNWTYLSAIKLLGDHTWEVFNEDINV